MSLATDQTELRKQHEQLVAKALQTGLLDDIWVVAVSGVTPEKVKMLGEQWRQINLGDEKKQ